MTPTPSRKYCSDTGAQAEVASAPKHPANACSHRIPPPLVVEEKFMHQSHCLPPQEKGVDFYSDTGLFVRLDRCVPISVSSLANFASVGPMALEQCAATNRFPYSGTAPAPLLA